MPTADCNLLLSVLTGGLNCWGKTVQQCKMPNPPPTGTPTPLPRTNCWQDNFPESMLGEPSIWNSLVWFDWWTPTPICYQVLAPTLLAPPHLRRRECHIWKGFLSYLGANFVHNLGSKILNARDKRPNPNPMALTLQTNHEFKVGWPGRGGGKTQIYMSVQYCLLKIRSIYVQKSKVTHSIDVANPKDCTLVIQDKSLNSLVQSP